METWSQKEEVSQNSGEGTYPAALSRWSPGCVQACVRGCAWFWQFKWFYIILKNGFLFSVVKPKSPVAEERSQMSFVLVGRCNIPNKCSSFFFCFWGKNSWGRITDLCHSPYTMGLLSAEEGHLQPGFWGTKAFPLLSGPSCPIKVGMTFIWPLSNCSLCNFDSQRYHSK